MRILDKYTVRNFFTPFFYCLGLFTFLYIIIDLFGHLDEILKNGVPILILQEYYLSMVPFIIIHTTPIAALISTIYVIGTMNRHDEITAMRAAGINVFRIVAPFIWIGLGISMAVFMLSEKMLPASMKNARYIKQNYIEKANEDKGKDKKIIHNIALYGKNNSLIFVKSFDNRTNTAAGITILEQDLHGKVVKKTNALEAKWTGAGWVFSGALIYKLDDKGMVRGNPLFFEKKDFDLAPPKELISKGTSYEFMSFKELSGYMRNFSSASPEIINKLKVDLHQKISLPFTSLVIILIGAALAIRIKSRGRTGAVMGIGISLVIGFIYYASIATCVALGRGGILPPILSAHLANIIFGLGGLTLIKN